MGVKRWRKKAEDRPAGAILLKAVLVQIYGPHVSKEKEEVRSEVFRVAKSNWNHASIKYFSHVPDYFYFYDI